MEKTTHLRRDLGTLESYAVLIGILIGAGIFQVTSQAWAMTGPSVILAYAILTPAVLATSIPYAAYLSTPLGREPGGEYLHISRTLKGFRLAYVGSWLKIISYVGAGAYLANALAGYLIALLGDSFKPFQLPIALFCLLLFYAIHVIGILWFGRMQVIMSALKLLALMVLIIPGLFVLKPSNYTPFLTHGWGGGKDLDGGRTPRGIGPVAGGRWQTPGRYPGDGRGGGGGRGDCAQHHDAAEVRGEPDL